MQMSESWAALSDALEFAVSRITGDQDPLNEREAADGHQYLMRMLTAVSESALLTFDPAQPAFMPMLESVRYLGASGPDIDYDVAIVEPGVAHRISGVRGGATYVGIAIYGHTGETGASGIVGAVDVDDLVARNGTFSYEFSHPEAARVIIRQYFHDRSTQPGGSWTIERQTDSDAAGGATVGEPVLQLPTTEAMAARVRNSAESLRWNAQLNKLWSPELRQRPNSFVRQPPEEIVAAVTNPDVTYAFSWWRIAQAEALVIDVDPPATSYWGLQLCDRWFQAYPERRSNINDRQIVREPDAPVRIVIADGDPGHPNWLDTYGHRTGVMFFRWLHADPDTLPRCRVVPVNEIAG
jgi:hypothetical protein